MARGSDKAEKAIIEAFVEGAASFAAFMLGGIGAGADTGPVEEITPGWFGRWFLRTYIEPSTQRSRAKAPAKIIPVASHITPAILDRFIASNASAREAIARAECRDVNRVRFRNPFAPLIRFTVGTGLQILTRHNHRHLLQAERVTQLAEFPRSR